MKYRTMVSYYRRWTPLKQNSKNTKLSRRALFGAVGKSAAATVALAPLVKSAIVGFGESEAMDAPVTGSAGVDRITVLGSKTYLHGWAGYGEPPVLGRPPAQNQPAQINYAGQEAPPPPAATTPTL